MMTFAATPLLTGTCRDDGRAILGEGPEFSQGTLRWVDIVRNRLFVLDTSRHTLCVFPTHVGACVGFAVATSEAGTYICGGDRGLWLLHTDQKGERAATPLAGSEALTSPPIRFNDAKVDPWGRLVAGTMDITEKKPLGKVYIIHGDLRVERLGGVGDVTISNGTDWSPEGDVMYYIDSPTRCIVAFDYRREAPYASGRRVVFDVGACAAVAPSAFPDGMAADALGRLWVALWGGHAIVCVDPRASIPAIVATVALPAARVTSCCFGDSGVLYITTAVGNTVDATPLPGEEGTAGHVYEASVGCTGRPTRPFMLSTPVPSE